MRDYAKKYSSAAGNRQKVAGRRAGGQDREQRSFKIIGVVTVAAMLVGVASSLWFGVALQESLGRLDKGRQEKTELVAANAALSAKKGALLQQEKIEAAAGRLGLFPPSSKQLRRP